MGDVAPKCEIHKIKGNQSERSKQMLNNQRARKLDVRQPTGSHLSILYVCRSERDL